MSNAIIFQPMYSCANVIPSTRSSLRESAFLMPTEIFAFAHVRKSEELNRIMRRRTIPRDSSDKIENVHLKDTRPLNLVRTLRYNFFSLEMSRFGSSQAHSLFQFHLL